MIQLYTDMSPHAWKVPIAMRGQGTSLTIKGRASCTERRQRWLGRNGARGARQCRVGRRRARGRFSTRPTRLASRPQTIAGRAEKGALAFHGEVLE